MNNILFISDNELLPIKSPYSIVEHPISNVVNSFYEQYIAIIIMTTDKKVLDSWLHILRSDLNNYSTLIFCTETNLSSHPLIDGLLTNDFHLHIADYQTRASEVNLNTEATLENKVLSYLWLNENRRIKPERYINNGVHYRYPFIECWDKGQGKELWLNRMSKAGLLSAQQLTDRIRQCLPCHSSLLNYVDTCPDCHSIDLKIESALHCFTCGHVGDQQQFIRSGEMVCPNCSTQLRHIGTDYDRPIENQRCNRCDNLFIDADVQAHCFSCGEENKIDDLIKKEYFDYCIGHNGIIKIKTGNDPQSLALHLGSPVSKEHYLWMASWLTKMALRKNEQHLFLGIRFSNLVKLATISSDVSLLAQIEAFCERLKNILRKTDIICQYNDATLFFLLPAANKVGLQSIQSKLLDIIEDQVDNPLEIKAITKLLPDEGVGDQAELWLTEQLELLN